MWREAALEKISNDKGTIDFKSKRELQKRHKNQIEEFEKDILKLKKIDEEFTEIPVQIIINTKSIV